MFAYDNNLSIPHEKENWLIFKDIVSRHSPLKIVGKEILANLLLQIY